MLKKPRSQFEMAIAVWTEPFSSTLYMMGKLIDVASKHLILWSEDIVYILG
jgi:hypothetical protein